jgi:hypothetical protein
MTKKKTWPIGEFVSFELKENEVEKEFIIILKGSLKYSDMIAVKIGELTFTEEDIDEYVNCQV